MDINDESTIEGQTYLAMLDWTGKERHPTGANGFFAGAKWMAEQISNEEKAKDLLAKIYGKPKWKMSLLKCKTCDTNHITNGKDFLCVCNVNMHQENHEN